MSILSGILSSILRRDDTADAGVPVPARVPSPPRARMDPREIASAPAAAGFTGPVEERRHERFVPTLTAVTLTTSAGKRVRARIINVSRTGVALEPEAGFADARDVVSVGARRVRPGRRIPVGMVFLFHKPLDAKHCGPDLVL